MHLSNIALRNVRTIENFEISLDDGERAGWHVILGDNGAGKSSVIRSIALSLIGPNEAAALRQDWSNWLQYGKDTCEITTCVQQSDCDSWSGKGKTNATEISLSVKIRAVEQQPLAPNQPASSRKVDSPVFSGKSGERTVWGNGNGWFSTSFGPFRRFSGGDLTFDRMFYSNIKAAPHLSAFGEDVALTESLRWLQHLHIRSLEKLDGNETIKDAVVNFINNSEFLPHNAKIHEINSEYVSFIDGDNNIVLVNQLSDGYRSILSLTFELLRQMFQQYDIEVVLKNIDNANGRINLPGVVAIDEIDAHLHPAWQRRIGDWFVNRFPLIQFFVTTHSPIICQVASRGSIWRLPTPGKEEFSGRVTGDDLNKLVDGSILDAYGTQFFGVGVTRSERSIKKMLELAKLNRKSLKVELNADEKTDLAKLRSTLPSISANFSNE